MNDAIRKADVLVEALGWIRQFRDRYVVIKLGGSALEESAAVRSVLTDVIFLAAVGMKPVLVHGGGKSITQAMNEAGIEPRFVNGRRFTDERTLEIVAQTLAGEICGSLVEEIKQQQAQAVGLSYLGKNCLIGRKLLLNGDGGQPVDLGRVGEVIDLDRGPIEEALAAGAIPVIPSIASRLGRAKTQRERRHGRRGRRPVVGGGKAGLFERRAGHLSRSPRPVDFDFASAREPLPRFDCRRGHRRGHGAEGRGGIEALRSGVRKVHIVDAAMPHAVLLEFYSDSGVGTEIVP